MENERCYDCLAKYLHRCNVDPYAPYYAPAKFLEDDRKRAVQKTRRLCSL